MKQVLLWGLDLVSSKDFFENSGLVQFQHRYLKWKLTSLLLLRVAKISKFWNSSSILVIFIFPMNRKDHQKVSQCLSPLLSPPCPTISSSTASLSDDNFCSLFKFNLFLSLAQERPIVHPFPRYPAIVPLCSCQFGHICLKEFLNISDITFAILHLDSLKLQPVFRVLDIHCYPELNIALLGNQVTCLQKYGKIAKQFLKGWLNTPYFLLLD